MALNYAGPYMSIALFIFLNNKMIMTGVDALTRVMRVGARRSGQKSEASASGRVTGRSGSGKSGSGNRGAEDRAAEDWGASCGRSGSGRSESGNLVKKLINLLGKKLIYL